MGRDYKSEYKKFHSSPEARKNRSERTLARYYAEKEGRVSKGDGKEIDHIKPLSKGGSNAKSNQRIISRKKNRSFRRGSDHRPL